MIILVRHGETALNAARVVQPPTTPLNERGQAQARAMAERVAGMGVERILCSHLERTRMTAAPLTDQTGVEPEIWEDLQERNFGDHRGTPYAELSGDIFAPTYQPPNGESWGRFHERVADVWGRVVQAAAEVQGNLVVITHGLVCLSVGQHHLRFSDAQPLPPSWGNTSVTLISKQAPHHVSLANCTAHVAELVRDGGRV